MRTIVQQQSSMQKEKEVVGQRIACPKGEFSKLPGCVTRTAQLKNQAVPIKAILSVDPVWSSIRK